MDINQEVDIKEFATWLAKLAKHKSMFQNVFVTKFTNDENDQELSVDLYTSKHVYHISAHNKSEHNSYLGCIMGNRAPDPGEKHFRGRDLPDGLLTIETWIDILQAIVWEEMIKIFDKPALFPDEPQPITFDKVLELLNIEY